MAGKRKRRERFTVAVFPSRGLYRMDWVGPMQVRETSQVFPVQFSRVRDDVGKIADDEEVFEPCKVVATVGFGYAPVLQPGTVWENGAFRTRWPFNQIVAEVTVDSQGLAPVSPPKYQYVCSPRYGLSTGVSGGASADGGCLEMSFDPSYRLLEWHTDAVVNITPTPIPSIVPSNPGDTTGKLLQPGMNSGWQIVDQATFEYGANAVADCTDIRPNSTCMTDSDGHATTWTLDSSNRVASTVSWTSQSADLITSQTWDANNNLIESIDPRGNVTDYAYDQKGNTEVVAQPLLSGDSQRATSLYTYDNHNNLQAYCDPIKTQAMKDSWGPSTTLPAATPAPVACPATASTSGTGAAVYVWTTSERFRPCITRQ